MVDTVSKPEEPEKGLMGSHRQLLSATPPTRSPPISRLYASGVLGCVLEQVISNPCPDLSPSSTSSHSSVPSHPVFTSVVPAPITIGSYLLRLGSLVENDSTLILAAYHLTTVRKENPGFRITNLNIHRLLLASLLCAVKLHEDKYYQNALYAQIGGVSRQEINKLEIEFLKLINFSLVVKPDDYRSFCDDVHHHSLHSHCKCIFGVNIVQRKHDTKDTPPSLSASPCPSPSSASSSTPPSRSPLSSPSSSPSSLAASYVSSPLYHRHFSCGASSSSPASSFSYPSSSASLPGSRPVTPDSAFTTSSHLTPSDRLSSASPSSSVGGGVGVDQGLAQLSLVA